MLWQHSDNVLKRLNNISCVNCSPTNIKLETHIVILDILCNKIYVVEIIFICTLYYLVL